ncbi:hypothetical protein [Streptomyces alanosinicus]|uniref:SH3 domain-containing protein n=1 Tax=Streptomyces alanosinicus TaxID=68171 RepID=A0A918YPI7_9ACTN|nr:hypothetical protein [Streptomyces alanosinicus]GHE10760.1 hypothetical protein GCM10010339_67990 [Streptomyces alanosinicus]
MLNNRVAAVVASAALAVASLSLAAPAEAAPAKAAASCWNGTVKAKESLTIRKKTTAKSTALGVFPKGATACFDSSTGGQKYKLCGKRDDQWSTIVYKGIEGYVVTTCIKF